MRRGAEVNLTTSLYIVQVVLSVALVALVLLQTKGGLGGLFGGEGSVARRRRGVEKTLFQITIGVSIVFFLSALATALWV
jgi:preprotein translocase subunit SecG